MTPTLGADQRVPSQKPAYRMAALLAGMGVTHFVAPKPFDSIVPAELPGSQRMYTYASGVAELATAGLIAVPRTRRLGGLAAILLFIGVFPANVNMCRLWWGKPLPMKLGAIARLPLQIPMIVQAVKIRRAAPRQ